MRPFPGRRPDETKKMTRKEIDRRYRISHREEILAKKRAYRVSGKARVDKRAWYAAHRAEEAARKRAYRETHKEEESARRKLSRERDKQKIAAAAKAYRSRIKHTYRARMLRREYGLTLDAYAALSSSQDERCAICRRSPNGKPLSVDHCHSTGAIRGLLCTSCNMGIGYFKDSPKTMRAAFRYLVRHAQFALVAQRRA